eukprot:7306479-Alexandrium_andersonii.AAC.1
MSPKSSSSSSRFQLPAAMQHAAMPLALSRSKAQRCTSAFSSGVAEGLIWMTITCHCMAQRLRRKSPTSPPGNLTSSSRRVAHPPWTSRATPPRRSCPSFGRAAKEARVPARRWRAAKPLACRRS